MITVNYYTKNVYGRELMYFADLDQANQFYRLTGRKTFEQRDVLALNALAGTSFVRVFEPVDTFILAQVA